MNNSIISQEAVRKLGLAVEDDAMEAFVAEINLQLEERIGMEIAAQLEDDQLEKMVELTKQDDKSKLEEFIEDNVEDLDRIVQDQVAVMLDDLVQSQAKTSDE